MWTAQTYLGAHVASAKYFIYLLCEDYRSEQKDFQNTVIENLRKLGMRTGRDSAIFVPDDYAKDLIKEELLDVFTEEIMTKIFNKTPGLLFTDKNLTVFNPAEDRWAYLSLECYVKNRETKKLPEFFKSLEETIKASDDLLKEISGLKWRSIWEAIKDISLLEPNLSGVGVDLKAIRFRYLITRNIK